MVGLTKGLRVALGDLWDISVSHSLRGQYGVSVPSHTVLCFLSFSVLLFTALLNQNEPWMRFPAHGPKKDPAALHQYRSLEPEPSSTYI